MIDKKYIEFEADDVMNPGLTFVFEADEELDLDEDDDNIINLDDYRD